MKRAFLIVFGLIIGLAGIAGYRIVVRSGMLKTIEPHHTGHCREVRGVVGAEDVTIDAGRGMAYLSADDRRATTAGRPVRGEIYALDLSRDDAVPAALTGGTPVDFHPHGISLWHGPEGERRLFVINHPAAGGHTVEIFDFAAESLVHVETIAYPELSSPNDLVAVGPRRFYATNDRRHAEGYLATLEAYLQLPWSSVSYFDGTAGRLVATGLVFANGINKSAGGAEIYVAELLGNRLRVYRRDAATGDLAAQRTIALGSAPDNIEVDEDGRLWVAAHPKVFDLLAHFEDAGVPAPSQVLRVDPDRGRVEEVFLDAGDRISAASTGAVAGDRMVIGAIMDARILVCDRPR